VSAKLVLERVGKTFLSRTGEVQALRGIDLAVEEGEFVTLVGPSGAGKTTLLNLVAGLERPDEGCVRVNGRLVRGPGPDRVVMFQEPALFPWLSVAANVEFGLAVRGMARRRRRELALAWLRMVHLEAFADAWVHELSGGMRQRVALVRALVLEPEVLLMDEPFAALDPPTRQALTAELEALWQRLHMTVLFVSHQVSSGVQLADRVVALGLRPGRVVDEYRVTLPRPRAPDMPGLDALVHRIEARTQRERPEEPERAG
jgi:NitT/TauT family transport system ATP-binding protein